MSSKTTIIKLNPSKPDSDQIRLAALAALKGKIVAFPTETVYGIGTCANRPGAAERLYEMKKRPQEKLFSYHISDLGAIEASQRTMFGQTVPGIEAGLFTELCPARILDVLFGDVDSCDGMIG